MRNKNKRKEDKRNDDNRNYKAMWFVAKEMEQYYKAGMETGLSELRFQLLVRDTLLGAIDEVIAFTSDPLAKKVLLLAKERETLDRLIHARTIFGPSPEGFPEGFKKDSTYTNHI